MNQRLVWRFEFTPKITSASSEILMNKETEPLKWEIRFFWPDDATIVLNTLNNSLLDLSNYQHKHHEDFYYLLPDFNYNIKRRRNQLLYKPLLKHTSKALGFGSKINIDCLDDYAPKTNLDRLHLQEIIKKIAQENIEVYVEKEAFTYKFSTKPKVKFELARLKVLNQFYLSACIEGKSRALVEHFAEHLIGAQVPCEYVTFLKNIMHHD